MNIAQSAASFVGTKATPKSRKPAAAKPAADHNQKVMAPITAELLAAAKYATDNPEGLAKLKNLNKPSIVASLAAQIVEAPKTEAKPKADKTPSMVVLTAKGSKYNPVPKRSKVKGEVNAATWATIKALFAEADEVSLADIRKAIPTHTDFVGYALRSGWLAAAA